MVLVPTLWYQRIVSEYQAHYACSPSADSSPLSLHVHELGKTEFRSGPSQHAIFQCLLSSRAAVILTAVNNDWKVIAEPHASKPRNLIGKNTRLEHCTFLSPPPELKVMPHEERFFKTQWLTGEALHNLAIRTWDKPPIGYYSVRNPQMHGSIRDFLWTHRQQKRYSLHPQNPRATSADHCDIVSPHYV